MTINKDRPKGFLDLASCLILPFYGVGKVRCNSNETDISLIEQQPRHGNDVVQSKDLDVICNKAEILPNLTVFIDTDLGDIQYRI